MIVAIGAGLAPLLLPEPPEWPLLVDHAPGNDSIGRSDPVVRYESYAAPIRSIDPATCDDRLSAGIVQGFIYEGLYGYDIRGGSNRIVPVLAADLPEVSPDGLVYTIRIRPNVHYAPNPCFGVDDLGRAETRSVQARDFVLAFKRCADSAVGGSLGWALIAGRIEGFDDFRRQTQRDPQTGLSRYDQPVAGLEAPDDQTLRIVLTEPVPQFGYVLAMINYAPVPREAIDYHLATEPDGPDRRRPVQPGDQLAEFAAADMLPTTGPYRLGVFQRKRRIVLLRNVLYRTEGRTGHASGRREDAQPDVIQFEYAPEAYSAWMRFVHGQTDTAGIPREVFETAIGPEGHTIDTWLGDTVKRITYESPAVYWLAFNMDDPVLRASPSLRRALCLGFDVDSWIRVLHNGRGARADNIIPTGLAGHAEAGPGPYYRLDRVEAMRQLDLARKELGHAGLLNDGQLPTLRVELGATGERGRQRGAFITQQFAKLGLNVKVRLSDRPTLQQRVRAGQTQIHASGWHAVCPDAETFLRLFASKNIETGANATRYRNDEYDALYDAARRMADTPERADFYAQLARLISRDCPVLLLSRPRTTILAHEWVSDIRPHPFDPRAGAVRRINAALRRNLKGQVR